MMKDHGGARLAEAVKNFYTLGKTDYFMEPLVRFDENGDPIGKIKDGDTVIFACRRGEREIELTDMFTDPDFNRVERTLLPNLNFIMLTLYHEKYTKLPAAFAPIQVQKSLAEIVSENGKSQLHCAEAEKFAHITYFLNGGNTIPFAREDDICIPSGAGNPAERPQMNLSQVVDSVMERLGSYDFIAVNFANGDVIGHTSDNNAKIQAAFHVSNQLERLLEAAKAQDYVIVVTADHGNLEVMTTKDGKPDVAHTTNPVPFVLIDPRCEDPIHLKDGSLCDVAPTILKIMDLSQPPEMNGSVLAPEHDFGGERKAMLVILDGWGIGNQDETDAIYMGETNYWDHLLNKYPHTALNASGVYVGLGEGKAGNSEAGHQNLGAGRIVLQDDQRIDDSVANGSFAQNPVFMKAIEDTKNSGAALHILAYLSKKSSHGSIDYTLEICRMAKDLQEVYLHIIFDGRSTVPGSAPEMLLELDEQLSEIGTGYIVDGIGRGFVLDRNGAYDKVKQGYDMMVHGVGKRYK